MSERVHSALCTLLSPEMQRTWANQTCRQPQGGLSGTAHTQKHTIIKVTASCSDHLQKENDVLKGDFWGDEMYTHLVIMEICMEGPQNH